MTLTCIIKKYVLKEINSKHCKVFIITKVKAMDSVDPRLWIIWKKRLNIKVKVKYKGKRRYLVSCWLKVCNSCWGSTKALAIMATATLIVLELKYLVYKIITNIVSFQCSKISTFDSTFISVSFQQNIMGMNKRGEGKWSRRKEWLLS